MPEVSFEIKGLKELAKQLDGMSETFARSTLRTGLRNSMRPVVKDAKARAPRDRGDLAKSLIGKVKVTKNGEGQARLIGRRSKGYVGGFYLHIIELGSSQHPARPFMRTAFDSNQGKIEPAFIDAINKTIARKLKKAGVTLNREEDIE